MSVHATWFIDWSFVSSSSSSCEATAIIVFILSLYRGSAVRKNTQKNTVNIVLDYCSMEVSMALACVTSWAGHSSLWWFSAGMSTAGTGFCSVAARTAGCVFVVDVGGVVVVVVGACSEFHWWQWWCCGFCTALPTEPSFFGLGGRSTLGLQSLQRRWTFFYIVTWRNTLLDAGWPQCGRYVAGCMGPRLYTRTQELCEHTICRPSP